MDFGAIPTTHPLSYVVTTILFFFSFFQCFSEKMKSGKNPEIRCHQQTCRPQNPRSARSAQLAARCSPKFGGGGPKARTTGLPRRSPFLCIEVCNPSICPNNCVELSPLGAQRNTMFSARCRAEKSVFVSSITSGRPSSRGSTSCQR